MDTLVSKSAVANAARELDLPDRAIQRLLQALDNAQWICGEVNLRRPDASYSCEAPWRAEHEASWGG
jgi:hypothetical protein